MYRAQTQAHLARNLCPRPALRTQLGYLRRVYIAPRAPNSLTLRACRGDARAYPLADQLALELGDRGEHAEHKPPVGRRGVRSLVDRNKLNSQSVKFLQRVHELARP